MENACTCEVDVGSMYIRSMYGRENPTLCDAQCILSVMVIINLSAASSRPCCGFIIFDPIRIT